MTHVRATFEAGVAITIMAVVLGAQSPEAPVTRLYVFGDSYSDNGAGYVDGDGPTAVAYHARRLGFELKPSTQAATPSDSLNFAVSGAQTGRFEGRRVKEAILGRGMVEQGTTSWRVCNLGRLCSTRSRRCSSWQAD